MTIKEIYDYAEKIGVLTFSTISEGEVHSRIAHFNGYDEDGIYLRTMDTKPYYRQLMKTSKLTVCGSSEGGVDHDSDGMALFKPGYTFRLIGEVRCVPLEELKEKAVNNEMLEMAVKDALRYPAMAGGNFVIHKAKVEIYDYDFECETRDHKLLRTRVGFGGATYNPVGPRITDKCISCGKCSKVCTFKAIKEGKPYEVISERCDDCGSCRIACPVDAIEESLRF